MDKIKTALVSVSDKTGLEDLASFFKENEVRVVSTGGTFSALKDLGVDVTPVSEITGFPEVMGGRVKTLHPRIHMGLLSRQGHESDENLLVEHKSLKFDLLVVNLYPFSKKKSEGLEGPELAEFIDVGGPSMIRAGAKNFSRLITLTSPEDYKLLTSKDILKLETRRRLAAKAFLHLSTYDRQVYDWLAGEPFQKILRYGENPHQNAKWMFDPNQNGIHQAEILQGKELSFNNLVDLTAALESLSVFSDAPCVVSVKHNNPCGVGCGDSIEVALKNSLGADPQSVFGGIIALNQELTEECAHELTKIFLECVVAPSVSETARDVLAQKKNLRVLIWPEMRSFQLSQDRRRVSGGELVQDVDLVKAQVSQWKLVSGSPPNLEEEKALEFSWRVVSRLKSNAIAVCGKDFSLGLGMGQVNRVDAVRSALARWQRFHQDHKGPVALSSDAFFPFADSIELIAEAGIKWVVQPGGSIKDQEVIDKAKDLGVSMFFTGKRHFLH